MKMGRSFYKNNFIVTGEDRAVSAEWELHYLYVKLNSQAASSHGKLIGCPFL